MDSERITLGSGKLYCIKFTGEIPDDATIETEDNQLAHIKGGASLEYTAESYTAKDDLGVVQKTKVTKEEAPETKKDTPKKEDIKVTKQTTEKEEEQPKKRTSKTRRTKKNNDQGVK